MATVTVEDLADLTALTLPDLDKGKFTDMSGDTQEFYALPNILKKDKAEFKTGDSISVNAMFDDNGQARMVDMNATDTYGINDVMGTGTAPWRHATWNWAIDRRESAINSGDAEQIVKLINTRRYAAYVSAAKLLESQFWGKPATSADETSLWGIDMYIVKNASTGFNGGNPSGFTAGEIYDSTVRTRWKNYTAQMTALSSADGVTLMRRAAALTQFKSPIDAAEVRNGKLRRAIYTNLDNILIFGDIARNQNENLGNDVAEKDGQATFHRLPIYHVPQLNSDSQDSIYGVDWSTFNPVFLKGEYIKESKPYPLLGIQHTKVVVDVDMTMNFVCYDRRRQWIINKA